MLENTGTPSAGQPFVNTWFTGSQPPMGLQLGDEYRRSPTSPIGVGLGPVITACGPYGMCRVTPAGISPAAIEYGLSAKNGPQERLVSPVRSEMFCRSIQVCGFPKFRSLVANKRCPCEPTYPSDSTKSFVSSR